MPLPTLMSKIGLPALILSSALAWAGAPFKMMDAQELATLMGTPAKNLAILDVNNDDTRHKDGTIPGAKLLSSSSKYDIAKELPSDKSAKLVFFCANTKCKASHKAAERAAGAGYTDVNVMSDGIQGWAKAGQAVTKVTRTTSTSAR